jgi:hypothetical protein
MSKRDKGHMKMMLDQQRRQKKYHLYHGKDVLGQLPDRLACEFLRVNELSHKVFVFKPTPKFNTIAETFDVIRNTHDPNELIDFVHTNPFYPEALYDLGEFFRLKGNYKEANRLLERILFLYEDSISFDFHLFDPSLHNIAILDPEYNNFTMLFFKTVFKFIAILTKKGCYQSALEFNKLLLKLNPLKDPLGGFLYIDHIAISAKKFDFLEDFAQHYADQYLRAPGDPHRSICLYPNIIYSLALSKLYTILDYCHEHKMTPNDRLTKIESDLADQLNTFDIDVAHSATFWISLATILYPSLLIKILEETELSKQAAPHSSFVDWQTKTWPEIFKHELFSRTEKDYQYNFLQVGNEQDTEGLEKVVNIYAVRNKVLWRNKFVNFWLKSVIGHLLNLIEQKKVKLDDMLETLVL